MTEVEAKKPQESLQDRLAQVVDLLHRHKLVEGLTHRQEGLHRDLVENLVHRQNLAELQRKLDELHSADVAHILEALPREDRLLVWGLLKANRDGDILLEVPGAFFIGAGSFAIGHCLAIGFYGSNRRLPSGVLPRVAAAMATR